MPSPSKPILKLLVANRGEIAIRIFRAASELKIRTVAIFTYQDRYSLHRYKADEAYLIGEEGEPLQPYLDIDEIIRVAKSSGADAIHPGYGFLSENPKLVQACDSAGIIFVGPSAEIMFKLGDKIRAKAVAREARVPVIEDALIEEIKEEPLQATAKKIGYPVMIKAASGGGGRGMRVVHSSDELLKACKEASTEAQTAFGDATIFIEKFVVRPKHIEVQILGDHAGNIIHLHERDCSVQRRFQKVVELAPAVHLPDAIREQLHTYALRIAESVQYRNAGTVEFLVGEKGDIYFIEVNPRIQVEHTITEEVTGVDIVRSQILIAMGHSLSDPILGIPKQEDLTCRGVSIQCRITTEDPENGFRPDYGTIIAYRSASGFGIRLDAGSAFAGAVITPFFDSMLVKVTARGRTIEETSARLHRALREFRIRGVNNNIGFLLNLISHPKFLAGDVSVQFIQDHPELLEMPRRKNRGTKILRYLGELIVNGNPDLPKGAKKSKLRTPVVPSFSKSENFPEGSRDRLQSMGRSAFLDSIRSEKQIQFTDTTFRDAHQSLIATRMRTHDLLSVAESYAHRHGGDLFSIEMWGGATFDVCMRFLREDPWARLRQLRAAMPNVLFQMLLRASNAVGYSAYPDNLVERFIDQAAEEGIDVFRVFDSLNWVEAMKVSIHRIVHHTDAIAEASICYSGDFTSKTETKFTLSYYVELAKQLEDLGAHMIAIKDMAGLLKPYAAQELIPALKDAVNLPIHLHTHDTSSIQSATYLKAIESGVDIIDVANSAFSGLTSQPNFNSIVAMLEQHERNNPINLDQLNEYSVYWEAVRDIYTPYETELKAGTAEIYQHEIPGGQYSNLRPQARGLGLEDKFERIKKNYRDVNRLLGGIVKVTPSSKVVGDMAMFMTSNNLTAEDILEKGKSLSFPDSLKALLRGDLGQMKGGFPKKLQEIVLKDEKPYTNRPNAHLEPIHWEEEMQKFKEEYGQYVNERDLMSSLLYPKVFREFHEHFEKFGDVSVLPSAHFFYPMEQNEEILVEIESGKTLLIKYLNRSPINEEGICQVFFSLNGQTRVIEVKDHSTKVESEVRKKAKEKHEVGAPLQGRLNTILVEEGDAVAVNQDLFTIEAMKMESTISSPIAGVVKKIYLTEKTMLQADDLVVEIEPQHE